MLLESRDDSSLEGTLHVRCNQYNKIRLGESVTTRGQWDTMSFYGTFRSAIFACKCRIRSKVTKRTDAYMKGIMGRGSASH